MPSYNVEPSYAHVICTTSSDTNAFSDDVAYLFDADHDDVVFESYGSPSIVWDSAAGTFTFKRAGKYHVVVNHIAGQSTAAQDMVLTTTFNLNSDSAIYTGTDEVNGQYDPTETTHQRIISISADDVLHIKVLHSHATRTASIEVGSAVTIMEVTSNVYASSTVTTEGSNDTTSEFNPLDTDLTGGPAFAAAGLIASGIAFAGTAGSMTVPSAGKYFIMLSQMMNVGGSTNSDVTVKVKEGSNIVWQGDMRANIQNQPREHTICFIQDLAASAVLTVTWDIGSGNVFADPGTTFTVYKLNDDIHERNVHLDYTRFGSVVNKAQSTASGAEFNPFDEDNYSSADFETKANSGVEFNSATGEFTVTNDGIYWIIWTQIFTVAADAVVSMKTKVNGTTVATGAAAPKIDSYPDPREASVTRLLTLEGGDIITVTVDSDSADIQSDAGSTMTIVRIPDWLNRGKSKANNSIGDDFTINTFKDDVLSNQHRSFTEQLPFVLGARGPLTLRAGPEGRNTVPLKDGPHISTGGKKN